MSIDKTPRDLITFLHRETVAGNATWRANRQDIVTKVAGATYAMWAERGDSPSRQCIVLGVTDGTLPASQAWIVEADDPGFPAMQALYRDARRHAVARHVPCSPS